MTTTKSEHPTDTLVSADGVKVRDLVPPVWLLTAGHARPERRTAVSVNVQALQDGRLHAYVSLDSYSCSPNDVYQSQGKAFLALAARKRAEADQAVADAFRLEAARAETGGAA
jgi:hypothetical protein